MPQPPKKCSAVAHISGVLPRKPTKSAMGKTICYIIFRRTGRGSFDTHFTPEGNEKFIEKLMPKIKAGL